MLACGCCLCHCAHVLSLSLLVGFESYPDDDLLGVRLTISPTPAQGPGRNAAGLKVGERSATSPAGVAHPRLLMGIFLCYPSIHLLCYVCLWTII